MNASRRLAQVWGLMALSIGCSQVLGIEDAHVDSALLGGRGGELSQSGSAAVTAGPPVKLRRRAATAAP